MRIGHFTTRLILTVSLLLLVGVVGISVGVYYFGKQLIEEQAAEDMAELNGRQQQTLLRLVDRHIGIADSLAQTSLARAALDNFANAYAKAGRLSERETEIIVKGLENYYTDSLAAAWQTYTDAPPAMADFIPTIDNAMALQYAYLADNPNPVGQKYYMNRHDGRLDYHNWHAEFHGEFGRVLDNTQASDLLLVSASFGSVLYSHRKHIDFGASFLEGGIAETRLAEVFMKVADGTHEGRSFTGFFSYPGAYNQSVGFVWAPMMRADEVVGVLFLRLDAEQLLQQLPETARTDVYLSSAQGELTTPPTRALLRPERFQSALQDAGVETARQQTLQHPQTGFTSLRTAHNGKAYGKGVELSDNYFGERVVRAYSPSDLTLKQTWLVTEQPADDVLNGVARLERQVWIIGGSIGGVILIAGVIVAFVFGTRVREAETAAADIVSGRNDASQQPYPEGGGLTSAISKIGRRQAAVTTYVEAINRDNYDKNLPFAPDDRLGAALRQLAVRVRDMNQEMQMQKRSTVLTTQLEQQFNSHADLKAALEAAFNHLRNELGISGVALYLRGESDDADRLALHTASGIPPHRQLSESPGVFVEHYKAVMEGHNTKTDALDDKTHQLLLPLRYDFAGLGLLQLVSEYPATPLEIDVAKKVAEVISLHASLKTARSRQSNLRRSLREDRAALKQAQEELKDLQKRRERERIELQNEIKALEAARESEQKALNRLRDEAQNLEGSRQQLESRLTQIESDLNDTRTKSEAEQRALNEAKAALEKKLQTEQHKQAELESELQTTKSTLDKREQKATQLEGFVKLMAELQAQATTASGAAAVDLATTKAMHTAGMSATQNRSLPEVVVDLEQLLLATFALAAQHNGLTYEPPAEAFQTPLLLPTAFGNRLAQTLQWLADKTYAAGFKIQGSVQLKGGQQSLHLRLSGINVKDDLGLKQLREQAQSDDAVVNEMLETATAEAAQDYILLKLDIQLAGSNQADNPENNIEDNSEDHPEPNAKPAEAALKLTDAIPRSTREAIIETFEIGDFAQLQLQIEGLATLEIAVVAQYANQLQTAVGHLDYIEMEDLVYQLQE